MIKLFLFISISLIDSGYTIDTHNYSFIKESFSNYHAQVQDSKADMIKYILDVIDLMI